MKRAVCKMCGSSFVQYHPAENTCEPCADAADNLPMQTPNVETLKPVDGHIVHRRRLRAKCDFCGSEHRFLCDFQTHEGTGTCDKKLCQVCVTRMGRFDYCPEHAANVKAAR